MLLHDVQSQTLDSPSFTSDIPLSPATCQFHAGRTGIISPCGRRISQVSSSQHQAMVREYNGFVNPRGLRARVGWGTGAGWQSTTLENPPPVVRVSWVCTRLLNFLIYITNYTFQKFQLPSCLVFCMLQPLYTIK